MNMITFYTNTEEKIVLTCVTHIKTQRRSTDSIRCTRNYILKSGMSQWLDKMFGMVQQTIKSK